MRIQFSIKENELINEREEKNENYEGIKIPVELQDKLITIGIKVKDAHKFNLFIEKYINDQANNNGENTVDVIGAELVIVSNHPPIIPEDVEYVKGCLEQILQGPKFKDNNEAKPEEVAEEDKYESVNDIELADNNETIVDEEAKLIG